MTPVTRLNDFGVAQALLEAPITAVLCLLTLSVAFFPTLASLLQYDRLLIGEGQFWRVLTCHLAHWNVEHLFWDTFVFTALGYLCETRYCNAFRACLAAAALIIPTAVWVVEPSLNTYRGLSGIDTALFALLAGSMLRAAWAERRWGQLLFCGVLGAAVAAKTGFECVTGGALFVDTAAAEFAPVPSSHVVGAMIGMLCSLPLLEKWKRRGRQQTAPQTRAA